MALRLRRNLADRYRDSRVGMPAIVGRGKVQRDNIAVFQDALARNTMYDLIVYRRTKRGGVTIGAMSVAQRARFGVMSLQGLYCQFVDLARRDARPHSHAQFGQNIRDDAPRPRICCMSAFDFRMIDIVSLRCM